MEMPLCQASLSEACKAQQQALGVLPERRAGRRHPPANPERPRAGSESEAGIPGAISRTPTRGSGGRRSPGCFSASRARRGSRPFHPDSARAPARQPAAAVSAAACHQGIADAWAATRATMTDYGEEQRNELEALESIYPDSFTGDFGGRPRRGGGRGPSSLSPVSFQHPPAPFPTVLKSEGPGGSVEALELIPTALSSRNRKPSKIH